MSFEKYIFCFFIYAFLGYICEVIYCSILQKKLVNRGYLYMPICPIYGYGAIIIILSMTPLYNMWYLVLILGILLTSTLEYLTSYFMELIFHMRWWDYSNRKFNIKGRVCLRNSLMFGALVMVVMYLIQPFLSSTIDKIDTKILIVIDGVLILAMIIDTILSTLKNINIAKLITKINYITEEATSKISEIKTDAINKIVELKEEAEEKIYETKEYLSNTAIALKLKELIKKYPNLKLRKIGKKQQSVMDFIEDNLDEENDVDNR